jgi:predicted TIM-barrel fold metal-dependent hydrolase
MTTMTTIDVHQHVWTTRLLDLLAARERWPFVSRERDGTVVHCAGEQPWAIDVASEAPARRAALLDADGLDGAVIALSSLIGIEALPREESLELIDAHLDGVAELGARFAAWGPIALDRPDPDDVDRLLARGCVGISIPASALAGPAQLLALGPLLERVAARDVPLFVHPGGAPRSQTRFGDPLWWPALTDYVAQMQAAWLAVVTRGRREHPRLRLVFAMLAGCAPLQCERLSARGCTSVEPRDPGVFYDTSSYGPVALAAVARQVGERQLLYGSDRPVIEPVRTGREAVHGAHAAALFAGSFRPGVTA